MERSARYKRRIFPVLGLAAAVFALATVPASEGDAAPAATSGDATPVVVELYASEGCSSCPSADAVLTRLARAQSIPGVRIVPLAMHVDYWDDLGWKDPFAEAQLTSRQRRFSAAKGERGVYTPEAVVDGEAGVVGSDEGALRRAIEASAKRAHIAVTVARGGLDTLDVRVAAVGAGGATEVDAVLAITEDDLFVDVLRGENSGRRLEHSAVVRELRSLGAVAPTGATFAPRIGAGPRGGASAAHKRHAVVIVEERRSRRVLGVGVLDL